MNAFAFSALRGIALLIAIVGVAVVLLDGVRIAAIGIAAGAAGGYAPVRVAEAVLWTVQLPARCL